MKSRDKPSKSRRRRRNEKRRHLMVEDFEQRVGPMPDYLVDFAGTLGATPKIGAQEAFERAPAHLVDCTDLPAVKSEVLQEMSRIAAERRTLDMNERIDEMQRHCPEFGKRGKARRVAEAWNRECPEDPVSIRTVQKYFKLRRV
ncbi:MAG: hypothetical protein ACO1OD_03165 [Croceibacterium sp.]